MKPLSWTWILIRIMKSIDPTDKFFKSIHLTEDNNWLSFKTFVLDQRISYTHICCIYKTF
jgi:hypothetical protein